MVHGKNRIPYWIDRRLTGLAGPDYHATISFGLPFELGDCPYGESRPRFLIPPRFIRNDRCWDYARALRKRRKSPSRVMRGNGDGHTMDTEETLKA